MQDDKKPPQPPIHQRPPHQASQVGGGLLLLAILLTVWRAAALYLGERGADHQWPIRSAHAAHGRPARRWPAQQRLSHAGSEERRTRPGADAFGPRRRRERAGGAARQHAVEGRPEWRYAAHRRPGSHQLVRVVGYRLLSAWLVCQARRVLSRRSQRSDAGFAPMYLYSQLVGGQNVGTSFADNLDLEQNQGIDTQADYAQGNYDYADLPTADETRQAAAYRIRSWTSSNQTGLSVADWIRSSLAAGNPVVIGIPVYSNFWNATSNSYFITDQVSGDSSGDHALFAPAYDQNGLWIANSWGTGWGLNGWAELSWSFVSTYVDSAVAEAPAGPAPTLPTPAPKPPTPLPMVTPARRRRQPGRQAGRLPPGTAAPRAAVADWPASPAQPAARALRWATTAPFSPAPTAATPGASVPPAIRVGSAASPVRPAAGAWPWATAARCSSAPMGAPPGAVASSGTDAGLAGVACLAGGTCFAVGPHGAILVGTDGGAWTTVLWALIPHSSLSPAARARYVSPWARTA